MRETHKAHFLQFSGFGWAMRKEWKNIFGKMIDFSYRIRNNKCSCKNANHGA